MDRFIQKFLDLRFRNFLIFST